MLGREASLWAEGCYSVLGCCFFHNHLLSGFLNQRPAPGRALQRFIYALLSLSFSLPLSLCSVLSAYNDAAQQRKNIPCDKETYFMQDDLDEAAERKACQFKRSWLGQCSGLQDANFGYSQGMPCILLRMNRVKKKMDFKISEIQITVLWINFTINLLCEWHLVVILGKTERKPFVIGCLFHA